MTAGSLSAIHIYPVKSCRAIQLDEVEVATTGLAGDRTFQVVDDEWNPVTQRQKPVLATVQPTLIDGGLRLEAEGAGCVEIQKPNVNDVTATSMLGVPVEAGDVGNEAGAWFSGLLGQSCRVVAMTHASNYRLPLPGIDLRLSWADAAPVLVVNTASLTWLSSRASEPFGMDRFRPNLTVDTDEPWQEDTWREFSIGGGQLGLGLAWPRCPIPQIDQQSGQRHKEPAKILKTHRWCSTAPTADEALRPLLERKSLFGLACSIGPVGTRLSMGDPLKISTTDTPIIAPPTETA